MRDSKNSALWRAKREYIDAIVFMTILSLAEISETSLFVFMLIIRKYYLITVHIMIIILLLGLFFFWVPEIKKDRLSYQEEKFMEGRRKVDGKNIHDA